MEISIHSLKKDKLVVGESLKVSDDIFALPYNEGLVHQVITLVNRKLRAGTRATKNRSAKRGGGKKPWRQKGTGRARAGTRRSPIWVGGGHTFAREPYDYAKGTKINKKMYRKAMHVILSKHIKDGTLIVMDNIVTEAPKTKPMVEYTKNIGLSSGLMVVDELTLNLYLSSRNIPNIFVCEPGELDPYIVFFAKRIYMTKDSIERYQQEYAA